MSSLIYLPMYPDIRKKIEQFEEDYGSSTSNFLLRYAVAKTSKYAVISNHDLELNIPTNIKMNHESGSFITDCKDFALVFGLKYKRHFRKINWRTLEFGYINVRYNRNKIIIYY